MLTPLRLPTAPRRWVHRGEARSDVVAALQAALGLDGPLCRLLDIRGFPDPESAKLFLRPRLDQLHDPFLLAGVAGAVDRIESAMRKGQTILVHGDYDVDGICSTALYTRVLRSLGATVVPFVPDRIGDGYDLGPAGIRAAVATGARLILTGDCGIAALDAVDAAAAAGIDVIVTDHHTPGPTLPAAVAVVNPNRPDCLYPYKGLAGVGVAFKLCQALYAARGLDPAGLWPYLDLVALATIADLAPLTGENRVFARLGLKVMAETRNPGLRALIGRAAVDPAQLSAGQVGHQLAPRINAVGRMDRADWGVRLLLAEDPDEAAAIADRLENENRTRQAVDRRTLREAMEMLERDFDPDRDRGVVLAATGWHPGVIGIVASRVVEQVHRPAVLIAIAEDGTSARGSARSIPGFHLYDAIADCAEHLDRFGGHKQAAGLDIRPDRIDAFRRAFDARARTVLRPDDLIAEVHVDIELPLHAANAELHRMLRHFGPFGIGNPTPVLVCRDVRVAGYPRVVGDGHVKLELSQNGARLPAIGFRMADRLREIDVGTVPLDVAFQLQDNHWNGRVELQAKLVDLRPAT